MLAIVLDLILVSASLLSYFAGPYLCQLSWFAAVSRGCASAQAALGDARRRALTWLQRKVGQLSETDARLAEFGRVIQESCCAREQEKPEAQLLCQFDGDERSSGLILYYIQLHADNLIYLYVLISELLECARLLRAAPADLSVGSNARRRDSEAAATSGHHQHCGRKLTTATTTTTQGDHELLDRYALLLMVVAYLEQQQQQKLQDDAIKKQRSRLASNEQLALTTNLLGFLESYGAAKSHQEVVSKISVIVYSSTSKSGASRGADGVQKIAGRPLRLCRKVLDDDSAATPRVVVLDPLTSESSLISGGGGANQNEAEQANLEKLFLAKEDLDHSESAANLTCHLATSVWLDISGLLGELHEKLSGSLSADTRCECQPEFVLGELYELCAARGIERQPPIDRTIDDDNEEEENELLMAAAECEARRRRKRKCDRPSPIVSERQHQMMTTTNGNSKRVSTKSGPATTNGWLARLKQNKLAKNLLYLALFIFVRTILIRYLESWQADLKHQARGDFINLKHMLFPELRMERLDRQTEDNDDGISILLRDDSEPALSASAAASEKSMNDDASDHDNGSESSPPDSQEDEIINEQSLDGADEGKKEKSAAVLSEAEQGAQVVEALLTAMLSQTMGGFPGGAGGGSFGPDKLKGVMDILARNANSGDGEPDDEAIERIMREMQAMMGGAGGDGDDEGEHPPAIEGEGGEEEGEGEDGKQEERVSQININSASSGTGDAGDLDDDEEDWDDDDFNNIDPSKYDFDFEDPDASRGASAAGGDEQDESSAPTSRVDL